MLRESDIDDVLKQAEKWQLPEAAESFLARLDQRLDDIEALAPDLDAVKNAATRWAQTHLDSFQNSFEFIYLIDFRLFVV